MTAIVSRAPRPRRAPPVPLFLFVGSLVLYVGVAVWTGQTSQLQTEGWVGLLQRMVALGIVSVGQTFVILVRLDRSLGRQSHQRRRCRGLVSSCRAAIP